jgi:hypothetical protein
VTQSTTLASQGQTTDLSRTLATSGIASFGCLYDPETIERWNARLDPLFAAAGASRSYVGADALARAGVLADCLHAPMRAVIGTTVPDARIYHAHAYVIAGGREQPHIHAEHLGGWHRDTETVRAFDPQRARHLSLFVYLTDVGSASGAFEFLPQSPRGRMGGRLGAHRMTGDAGTAFVWNRSYYHRASPNRSNVRRRVLKLSWQSADLANDRIGLPEMVGAAAALTTDPYLRALFGGPATSGPAASGAFAESGAFAASGAPGRSGGAGASCAPGRSGGAGGLPPTVPLAIDTDVVWGRRQRLAETARVLRHRVTP